MYLGAFVYNVEGTHKGYMRVCVCVFTVYACIHVCVRVGQGGTLWNQSSFHLHVGSVDGTHIIKFA